MSYLTDLVWVGNTLLPRWLPLAVMAIALIVVVWSVGEIIAVIREGE